jgi:integrating conjugative element protein (TIGR03755 family)
MNRIRTCLLTAALGTATLANAQSGWYYEMGGATPFSQPSWTSYNAVPLNASGDVSWAYSCGKFNMSNSVNKLLQDVRSSADDYLNAMISNAQAAVSSLPAIILQRASPSLYDIMQNGLLRAQASANAARLDCKAMEDTIIANGGGVGAVWDNFKQAAKVSDWKAEVSYSRNDIVRAQKNVEANAGKNGIAWPAVGGGARAGGDNQPPIQLSGDIARAGFKLASRAGNPVGTLTAINGDISAARGASTTSKNFGLFGLFNFFPTEQSAADYVKRVVGEVTVTTTDTGQKQTQPGFGLREEVAREAKRVYDLLAVVMVQATPMSDAQRNDISKGEVKLTDQLINAVREMPAIERQLVTVRLANEIALQNEIAKAIKAIELIRLGGDVPEIYNLLVAQEHTEEMVDEIKKYIDELLYEKRINQEIVALTATQILDRAQIARSGAILESERSDEKEPELGTETK